MIEAYAVYRKEDGKITGHGVMFARWACDIYEKEEEAQQAADSLLVPVEVKTITIFTKEELEAFKRKCIADHIKARDEA